MPKAGGPRLEATLEVVGVDTGGSYAWVIHTGKGAALVDCGIDARGSAILGELSRLGLKPADVHTVLVTHGHGDHVAACALFPNAKVYVGPGEPAFIRGEKKYGGLFPRLM